MRILPRSLANVRHLLLALLAIGLVLRMGGGCEAMAATPAATAAHQAHCANMPARPDKPTKSNVAACALCIALPDRVPVNQEAALLASMEPVASLCDRLVSLTSGPAPPPPKIA